MTLTFDLATWLLLAANPLVMIVIRAKLSLNPTMHNKVMGRTRPGFNDWLVGCSGLNGPLRQYFSLYRAVSQREGERKEK